LASPRGRSICVRHVPRSEWHTAGTCACERSCTAPTAPTPDYLERLQTLAEFVQTGRAQRRDKSLRGAAFIGRKRAPGSAFRTGWGPQTRWNWLVAVCDRDQSPHPAACEPEAGRTSRCTRQFAPSAEAAHDVWPPNERFRGTPGRPDSAGGDLTCQAEWMTPGSLDHARWTTPSLLRSGNTLPTGRLAFTHRCRD
jgi:hypothetical protein